jgi:branched-chain amino acid transport system substrate-binding protein
VKRPFLLASVGLGAVLVGSIFLPGCGGKNGTSTGDPNIIKIVSSLPRTGSAKGQTDTIVNGIKMAFEEVDYKVGNFKIMYEDLDDATAAEGKWTSEREAANADQAVKDADVMVFLGPYNSGAAKVSMVTTNKAGLLMISPAVTWPGMTKPGKGDPGEPEMYRPTQRVNFTRVVPADDLQGPLGAVWAKSMGVKTVAILDDNEVYGKGIATLFKEKCEELKIQVLGAQESIDIKQNDFRNVMSKIAQNKPDLIYFGGTSQTKAGQIAKDILSAGMKDVKLMVPDGCYELAFIQAAGAETFETLKCYVTFGGLPPDKLTGKGKEFVDKYKVKYGKMPEGYAIYGYEAGKVAVEAIKRAGKKDRKAILDACLAIKDFDGALGKWSFDANGDTTSRTMSGSTVVKGDFQFVRQLDELEK